MEYEYRKISEDSIEKFKAKLYELECKGYSPIIGQMIMHHNKLEIVMRK